MLPLLETSKKLSGVHGGVSFVFMFPPDRSRFVRFECRWDVEARWQNTHRPAGPGVLRQKDSKQRILKNFLLGTASSRSTFRNEMLKADSTRSDALLRFDFSHSKVSSRKLR